MKFLGRLPVTVFKSVNDRQSDILLKFKTLTTAIKDQRSSQRRREICSPTVAAQTAGDVSPEWLQNKDSFGLLAFFQARY